VFDWLFEGKPWVYAILAAPSSSWRAVGPRPQAALAVPDRGLLVLVGVSSSSTWRGDRAAKRSRRKLQEMAGAVKKRDTEGIFRHISDRFKLGTLDKAGFRQR